MGAYAPTVRGQRNLLEANLAAFKTAGKAMNWLDAELVSQRCGELSRLFYRWLRAQGHDVEILEVGNFRGSVPSDASVHWRSMPSSSMTHKVVTMDDWIADPSSAQFGRGWPELMALGDCLEHWERAVFSVLVPSPCQSCSKPVAVSRALRQLPEQWPCLACGGSGHHQLDVRHRRESTGHWTVWHQTPAWPGFRSSHARKNYRMALRPWPRPGDIIADVPAD